jgi:hypothetical protein
VACCNLSESIGKHWGSTFVTLLLERIDGPATSPAAAGPAHTRIDSHPAWAEVFHAADAYLHSGQSSAQHARPLRAVQRARERGGDAPLALGA